MKARKCLTQYLPALPAARSPVLPLILANIFCCFKGMDIPRFSSYSRTGVFEGMHKGADPREMPAEDSRQVFDTSWQPSACGDKTTRLEALYHDLTQRLVQVEEEISKKRVWSDSVDTRLQFLESCHRAFLEGVTQKELQEKEEYKKLKEKTEELEARNKELLSKAMGMHKHSENMNDAARLSAVLQMYEMLRVHDWEKLRSSTASYLSYKSGSSIIKKLFDACEKDIQQRTANIFEVLEIPPSNEAMTKSKQGVMQEIWNLFRYSYYQNHSGFYSKIVMEAGIDPKTDLQRQFTLQCCKTYCLLLLQDPPVKAVWNLQESSIHYFEHVDKKDWKHWRKAEFLWPIMKCGEQVIVKGVVWDEK